MLAVVMRPIESVKPYDRNPRHNDGAVEAVANSIRTFGFRQPIVVDREGVVVVGHTRLKAALRLGMKEVPVHVAGELTPEQARAYRLADNQIATLAEFDNGLLAGELAALQSVDFDLSLLGWSPEELTELMAPPPTTGLVDADDVPEAPIEPVTRRGDTWILGAHRLRCGDSTDPADVEALMNGEKAALCATDPPYLVDYTGDRPNGSGKDWTGSYREIDIADADRFFRGVFTNVVRVLAPRAAIYTWHAHKRQALIARVWEDLGILDHQQIVWVKPTAVFGRVYWHFQHEPCMMGWVKGSQPEHDANHEFTSVWTIDWEGKARIVGNEHPTQKPVEIFARPIRKHTRPGDVCFEPFCGSGSQIIAAGQLGRRCYAMELEPVFVDVACRRYEQFSGKQAVREADGVGYADAAALATAAGVSVTTGNG